MLGNTTEILFDKFEIVEVLKKDEHAGVYLANHIYLSKKIILKVLNTQKLPDQAIVERFKREAKLLARLDHPNIIKVLDFGTSKEYFYISFEYIEGTSLRYVLTTQTLSLDQKKHLTIQLLKALHYAHSFQIIHRDIKPENIFIDANLNLKLGDFGLALSSEDNLVTNPYSIVGTPSYMSPEQVRGAKLTSQSDLFSAGVVLVELYSGKNPFLKENVTMTLNEIISYDENSLEKKIENLPQDLKDILYNLLRKKPELRYPSALEALNKLNVSMEQQTVNVQRDIKKLNRERLRLALIIASLLIIVVTVISLRVFLKTPQEQTAGEQIKQKQTDDSLSQNNHIQESTTPVQGDSTSSLENSQEPLVHNTNTEKSTENKNNNSVTIGWLSFDSHPYAIVSVDGERIGPTPISPIPFETGVHNIKFSNPDYPPYTQEMQIKPGQAYKINLNLDTTMAYIKCDARPWADVIVNNVKKGTTPTDYIKVVPGVINLILRHPEWKDVDTLLNLKRNDTLNLKFTFKIRK